MLEDMSGGTQPVRQTTLNEFLAGSSKFATSLDEQISFVENINPLLEQAAAKQAVTELAVVPTAFDRRTIKSRIAERDTVRWSLALTTMTELAKTILETVDKPTEYLDRIDRLHLNTDIIEDDNILATAFRRVIGGRPTAVVETVEQIRSLIELITNYHPDRIAALDDWTASNTGTTADIDDILTGVQRLEAEIRQRSERAPSAEALLRRVTRDISATDGAALTETYPDATRLWIGGLSSISAPLIDFIASILYATTLDINIITRPASRPLLKQRFPALLVDEMLGVEVI